jgi:hypothetical protein
MIGSGTGMVRQIQKYQLSGGNFVETNALRHQLGAILVEMQPGDARPYVIGLGRQESARINDHGFGRGIELNRRCQPGVLESHCIWIGLAHVEVNRRKHLAIFSSHHR